jgi:trehalose 2-sulfotransferase
MTNEIKSYLICATPRSGSSLLCEALRNTGLAGNPDEYFGPMHVERWNERWQTHSEIEYLEKAISYSKGATNVISMKIMRVYWRNFLGYLYLAKGSAGLTEFEILKHWFPNLHFIFITRHDKVRQGISWLKFLQGSAWHWIDGEPQKLENWEFEPDVVQDFIVQTTAHETAWLEFFRKNEIKPFTVVYEDLVSSYEETAKTILKHLRIDHPVNLKFGERQFKKQADELTDEWVERYLNTFQDTEKM